MIQCKHCENEANVPGTAKGLCRSHYKRYLRYGDPLAAPRRVNYNGQKCSVRYCINEAEIKGVCTKHYASKRRGDDPTISKRASHNFAARLLAKREHLLGRSRPATCELCGQHPYGRGSKPSAGICFDHDHATGKPRGWLCDRCNKVLGLVSDSKTLLRILANYLEEHEDGKVNHVAQEVAAE